MSNVLLFIVFVIAVINWYAVARGNRKLEYFAKPATMVALLAWLWVETAFQGFTLWFALGLVFSLAGDVFLMLPRDQFIAGLVSFLLAHLAYLVGFNTTAPPLNLPTLIVTLLVLLTTSQLYRRIAAGLQASGNTSLKIPVLTYSLVISLMLISALLTFIRNTWLPASALLAGGGAFLFYLSDAILAWNKFVFPLKNGRVYNMVTYHLGQILMTMGVAIQFLGRH